MDTFPFEGSLISSKENRAYLSSVRGIETACERRAVIEQYASMFDTQKRLCVNLAGMRGYIPFEECGVGFGRQLRDISVISRVGKPVCFVIEEICSDGERPYALCSRRAVQQQCLERYVTRLRAGDVISAHITHIERFGCFCDVGAGICALLRSDSLSVSRVSSPLDRVHVGQTIRAVVRGFDEYSRPVLSMRELLGSWEENARRFRVGETHFGIIRSVEPYGVFVELTANLAGLAEPFEGARAGLSAAVYIKSILPNKMKIKLAIVSLSAHVPAPDEPEYLFTGEHMDSFVYSPKGCEKLVCTHFDNVI